MGLPSGSWKQAVNPFPFLTVWTNFSLNAKIMIFSHSPKFFPHNYPSSQIQSYIRLLITPSPKEPTRPITHKSKSPKTHGALKFYELLRTNKKPRPLVEASILLFIEQMRHLSSLVHFSKCKGSTTLLLHYYILNVINNVD